MLQPGVAEADFVLDTGLPTGTGGPVVLSSSQWLAAEFAATAGADITDFSAYLTQGSGQPGDTFTFDVYSASGFTNRSSSRPAAVFSATGTFTANGWNVTAVNWTPSSSGDYWLALQVSSPNQTKGLDAPVEASATTGTAPALGFAYAPSSGQFTTSGAPSIGLEITESTPVPIPGGILLLGSGMFCGLGAMARRRRVAAIKP